MNNRLTKRLERVSGKDLTLFLAKISKIDEFKGWWKGSSSLNPQALGRLKRSIVVTSTGASTRIEGSQLSDKEVERLLKSLSISKLKDRDSQEVAGYAEVLKLVFDSYQSMPFTEGLILQLHKALLQYSEKDKNHRGRYKISPNKVVAFDQAGGKSVLFNTTHPHLTPIEMRELVEWTRAQLKMAVFHPILIIANFIVEFLAIHPFHDGNGRMSRVLTNLLLAQAGYSYMPYVSLEKIIEDHKTEYYLTLRVAQKDSKSAKADVSKWLRFFIDVMIRQIEFLKDFIENEPSHALLSVNQEKTLNLFEKHEYISTKLLVEEFNVPTVTAKQILNRLLELKLIERTGAGRSTRYHTRLNNIPNAKSRSKK